MLVAAAALALAAAATCAPVGGARADRIGSLGNGGRPPFPFPLFFNFRPGLGFWLKKESIPFQPPDETSAGVNTGLSFGITYEEESRDRST